MKLKNYIDNLHEDFIIHCKNNDEANLLIQCLSDLGRTWCTGENYIQTLWDKFKENTVYYINDGKIGDIDVVNMNEYCVVEFSEIVCDFVIENNKNIQVKKQLVELIVNHFYTEISEIGISTEIENILTEFINLADSWEEI